MATTTTNRRLAAIVFADIEGYSAMMQRDEQEGLQKVTYYRKVLEERVKAYQGEILQHYGDGTLFIFSSGVSALQCAKELQETFRGTPKIPLRIGIHIGDIVIKGNDIYGDGVNLTARVESLSIPGAVLFTKRLLPDLKSHPIFKIANLGKFRLKNIDQPVEIFALANEGFPVPSRQEMRAKSGEDLEGKKWKLPALTAFLLLLVSAFWYVQSPSSTGLLGDLFPAETPTPNEIRNKRVAVMVFDNQTRQDNLESLGLMASDWLTQGLMEVQETEVASAANVLDNLSLAGAGITASKAFAKATKAEVIIQGRYYQQGEKLFIHCNIIAANSGRIIHVVEPIESTVDNAMQALDELTHSILAFYELSDNSKYDKRIPNYEAYQASLEANKYYYQNTKKVEDLLLKAYSLDTTFMEPLLKLAKYYIARHKLDKCDSLVAVIQGKQQSLTGFEKLRLAAIAARNTGQFEKSASLNLQIAERYDANYYNNVVGRYLAANNLKKTLEYIPQIVNLENIGEIGIRQEGTLARPIYAQYRLGNYQRILDMIDTVWANPNNVLKINSIPITHLRALLELEQSEKAAEQLAFYLDKNNPKLAFSNKRSVKTILSSFAYDKYRLGQPITAELEQLLVDNKMDFEKHFIKEEYQACLPYINKMTAKYPNSKYWIALAGKIHAHLGNKKQAIYWIDKTYETPSNYKKGDNEYQEAVIRTALGEFDKAVEKLKLAHEKGFEFSFDTFQYDPFLKPLYGHSGFMEFVAPRM